MTTYPFSAASQAELDTCHLDLVRLFSEIAMYRNCSIFEGRRGEAKQNEMFRTGLSELEYPNSKHNVLVPTDLSLAVDAGPYFPGEGIPWEDRERWLTWGGFVLGVAAGMGIGLRHGGDWDGDWLHTDQKFHDMPHFELTEVQR